MRETFIVPEEQISGDTPKTNLELLIERIKKIQEKIPEHKSISDENEEAFTEAAEEQYDKISGRNQFINNRRRR